MINERENGYLTVGLYERSFGAEAAGDYTLPDYQSEIRRILHVKQTVLPPATYVGSDAVEFNGTVDYQVIYVGGDGGIYSVPLSEEYSFSVPIEKGMDTSEGINVLCHVCPEGVSTRVSSPRRLSIRSRLRPNVRIFGRIPTASEQMWDENSESIFKKTESCMSLECESAVSELIPLTYIAPMTSDDIRVVSADANIYVTEKECTTGGISCRGRAEIELLCVSEESGDMTKMVGEVPFESEIDSENSALTSLSRVRGILSEMSVNVGEGQVECNAGILLEAVACRNSQVEYISDVYSTESDTVCETVALEPRRLLACANGNVTVSERVPLSDTTVPEGAQILQTYGNVVMDKCAHNDGKYIYTGNAKIAVIWRNEDDINSSDVSVPVRFELQGAESGEPVCFDACAELTDIKARAEEENLRIDAEMMVAADCMGNTQIQMVSDVAFGEQIPSRAAELIVCYPTADDTLWSVAKRYKVSPTDILGDPETDGFVMIQ